MNVDNHWMCKFSGIVNGLAIECTDSIASGHWTYTFNGYPHSLQHKLYKYLNPIKTNSDIKWSFNSHLNISGMLFWLKGFSKDQWKIVHIYYTDLYAKLQLILAWINIIENQPCILMDFLVKGYFSKMKSGFSEKKIFKKIWDLEIF